MRAWLLALAEADARLLYVLSSSRSRRLDRAMLFITRTADPWPAVALPFALATIPGWLDAGVPMHALLTLVVSHVLAQGAKRLAGRDRPRLAPGLGSILEAPDRFSFPSGHATAALAIALPVTAHLGASAGAPVLAAALLVGFSRCYLGVHYPGDVVAGWGLAGLSFWALDGAFAVA